MLRPANPTDALALLPLQLRAAPNEARSGAVLGKPPGALAAAGVAGGGVAASPSASSRLGAVAARRPGRRGWDPDAGGRLVLGGRQASRGEGP